MTDTGTPTSTAPRPLLRTITGVVASDKGDKTIKVVVNYQTKHAKYGKYLKHRSVLHAHDATNEAREGDLVEIASNLSGAYANLTCCTLGVRGALLCFDMSNIRYITATHIGTWAADKLNRFCLLPQGDEQPTDLHTARLALCQATRQVIANGLAILGVSAPERM